ncbi:efflux RND transporter periplasmic adaptor subunit [Paraglaciecola arctica]|uniref:efflux RND transporter periplasmic adaptor subunit n=1 Tax=Paraglaciecola arctica TaxID=1128911 RepID=UPI001C0708A8|nr:efflux RND transporter periplasmic adaptor subunit [Paraglaciecola arctica]MBU3004936.1 efflux RND transporter periplasmic adaptor subunit [Paraglaciecola arctica]
MKDSLIVAMTVTLSLFSQLVMADGISSVAALGRIEPENGIIIIGAPSTPESTAGSLIAKLHVAEGDSVTVGQLIAEIDSAAVAQALVVETEKEYEFAVRQFDADTSVAEAACVQADTAKSEALRREKLLSQGLAPAEEVEQAQGDAKSLKASCQSARVSATAGEMAIEVAKARLERRKAEYQRKLIYSPIDGMVLQVNAYPGEFVHLDGVVELAAVQNMYAVAEIYETDINRVRIGQKATISSDALEEKLTGKVSYIQPKVQKHDAIGTDPAARKDARIIEVDVLLDNPQAVRRLINLQVEIVLE